MTFPHTWACIANLSWVCPPTEPKPSVSYPHDTHTLYPIKKKQSALQSFSLPQGGLLWARMQYLPIYKLGALVPSVPIIKHIQFPCNDVFLLPFLTFYRQSLKKRGIFFFMFWNLRRVLRQYGPQFIVLLLIFPLPLPPNNFCWINKFSILFKLHTFAGNWPSISRRKLSIFFLLSSSTDAQIDQINENKNHSSIMRG